MVDCGKRQSIHPWEAATAAASAAPSAANAKPLNAASSGSAFFSPFSAPDFGAPHSWAIHDAACSLLLACLDRGRKMTELKAMQVLNIDMSAFWGAFYLTVRPGTSGIKWLNPSPSSRLSDSCLDPPPVAAGPS